MLRLFEGHFCSNERLRAWAFSASNSEHLLQLKKMGIEIDLRSDGTVQLSHVPQMVCSFYLVTFENFDTFPKNFNVASVHPVKMV